MPQLNFQNVFLLFGTSLSCRRMIQFYVVHVPQWLTMKAGI